MLHDLIGWIITLVIGAAIGGIVGGVVYVWTMFKRALQTLDNIAEAVRK